MLKRILTIFMRDLKVSFRDFTALYILVFPLLFAVGINLLTPSINETTINLAVIEDDNPIQVEYFEQFANVIVLKGIEEVEERVSRRDDVIGILPDGDNYYILQEGNETEGLVDYARLLLTLYEEDVQIEDSTAIITDFGREEPPLKRLLVNIAIIFNAILAGMLVAMHIIEEKVDKTIRAVHLSPVSRNVYLIGKSIIGVVLPIYGAIAITLITGFTDINWFQMIIMVLTSTIISLLVGFIQGVTNEDVMSAMSGIKMLMLPMAAGIAAVELLSDFWQKFFYWVPFYWTYKGTDAVLGYTATWAEVLIYSGIVLGISIVVYILLMPKIRKGLE